MLRYLKGRKCILFKPGGGLVLEAYANADYIGSLINERSTTDYTFLGSNLVT